MKHITIVVVVIVNAKHGVSLIKSLLHQLNLNTSIMLKETHDQKSIEKSQAKAMYRTCDISGLEKMV